MLCKMIDTESLKSDKEIIEVINTLQWFFEQKNNLYVTILNPMLEKIFDIIIEKDYNKALVEIKKAKKVRMELNELESEAMYRPSKELYKIMSRYDYKYI